MLANLDEKRSSAVLGRLREEQTTDVLYRIANMKEVPAEALSMAEKILSAGLPEKTASEAEIDGVRVAAMLLNQIDTFDQNSILFALDLQNLTTVTFARAADDDNFVSSFDLLGHPQSTSGARDIIRMNLTLNSRATGPKIRVPFGVPSSLMMAMAFSSKRR